MSTLPEIIVNTIQRTANMMDKNGIQYKIIMPDGTEYGSLVTAPQGLTNGGKPRQRKGAIYGHGVLADHIAPYMDNLQSGEVAVIPLNGYDVTSVASAVSGRAHNKWGNGTYTTHRTPTAVEIMRF